MPYFAEFLINSVSIRHRFAYDAGRSRDPRIRVIPLRRPGPEERPRESRKYPSRFPPPCWTASAEHAKDYAAFVRLRSRGDLIRSAVPQHHSPRSVEFRVEIGPVPRRDRFTSGSRSVRFRVEIGSLPARDRFRPAAAAAAHRRRPRRMRLPEQGLYMMGHARRLAL